MPFTEVLSKDYKKPVPFRNHYYFKETSAPAAVLMKQGGKQLTESATQMTNGDEKLLPAAKPSPAAKLPAKPTLSAMATCRNPSPVSKTPAKEAVKSLPTIPEGQHNDDNLSDAFMIDHPRRTAAAKPKHTPKLQAVTRNQRILN